MFSSCHLSRKVKCASSSSCFWVFFPIHPFFQPLVKLYMRNYWWLWKNVTQLLIGRKTATPLPAPLFIFLLDLLGFTLKLTHNFVPYLFIVTGKSLLSSDLGSLEWRQIQNHSSGNSSGDNGFRNSSLEVKAELLIPPLEYLQVWPKGESKYFGTVKCFCITWNMNGWRRILIGLMNTTSCMFALLFGR